MGALAAAGLGTDSFRFCGFLPPKTSQRRKLFEELKQEDCTLVFYEAPHRILETLEDIASVMRPRPVVIARELTKLLRRIPPARNCGGTARDARSAHSSVKGEITLLIGKADGLEEDDTPIEAAILALESSGVSHMDAVKQVAKARGLSKREVYKLTL